MKKLCLVLLFSVGLWSAVGVLPAPAAASYLDQAQAMVELYRPKIEAAAGRPFLGPVAVKSVTRAELRTILAAELAPQFEITLASYPAEVRLAVLGQTLDYMDRNLLGKYCIGDSMFIICDENIRTFADTFALGETETSQFLEFITAHELIHALDDQHFDLRAGILAAARLGQDPMTAYNALLEGNATLLAAILTRDRVVSDETRRRAEALTAGLSFEEGFDLDSLRQKMQERGLMLIYGRGADFVGALMVDGGPEAVAAAFRNPPRSMSVILHPRRYRQPPPAPPDPTPVLRAVEFDGLPAEGVFRIDPTQELQLRALLASGTEFTDTELDNVFQGYLAGWMYSYTRPEQMPEVVVAVLAFERPEEVPAYFDADRKASRGRQRGLLAGGKLTLRNGEERIIAGARTWLTEVRLVDAADTEPGYFIRLADLAEGTWGVQVQVSGFEITDDELARLLKGVRVNLQRLAAGEPPQPIRIPLRF